MKALSVRQPWAELIASGRKSIELRTWKTSYRGPLLICAASAFSASDDAAVWLSLFDRDTLSRGVAIAQVELLDVRRATVEDARASCCVDPTGHFAWVLSSPQRIKPRRVKGQLSLFEVTL